MVDDMRQIFLPSHILPSTMSSHNLPSLISFSSDKKVYSAIRDCSSTISSGKDAKVRNDEMVDCEMVDEMVRW